MSICKIIPGRRPAVGEEEHRGVQRRPHADHHRRAAGRRRIRPLPHAITPDKGTLPPGVLFSAFARFSMVTTRFMGVTEALK